nr:response regulator [Haloplanus sp. XH21]
MLADDEPGLLDLYSAWLEGMDVELVRASCGAEALSHCEDGAVDVAILDRHMPRLSGDEVLETLCDRQTRPRVAFVTAAEPDVRIVELEIDAYLTKPVECEEFVGLIRALLQRETLCEAVEGYVVNLSKRAALLESKSCSMLRNDPTYTAFEEELSRMASQLDGHHVDDPYLRRLRPDGSDPNPAADAPP